MILRSITKHVQAQNWLAVFLDFFIVVVGVFIGIQVANWNDERLEAQQQHRYQLSFKSDLQSEMTDTRSRIAYQTTQALLVGRVRSILEKEALPDQKTSQEMITALHLATFKWVVSVTDITVNELTSSGKLHLLGDLNFRKSVQSFYRRYGTTRNTKGINDDYRVLVRSIIPPELQQAITNECNNFDYDLDNIEASFGQCDIDLSDWDTQELVREIQSRPQINDIVTYRQSFLMSDVGWAKSMLGELSELTDQLAVQKRPQP